ncbi:ERBB receptor feedback inhibitor 1 [Pimephales promelas]|uniref:ERBB receptor feedback inhibitor 1 n=1 Tax=Pimephales promelas TaxID=90988 RepID=UPI001955D8E8|nr:ERBB receptor feedback inhibitor 1 [Pimephales promelas]XP_039508697.1 ERBB receptor feedback inhibitor 1 [Pimephales promelas]KAG1961816.1 ERBB receptor feedback inhibitor [Pimephales promelas]
MATAQPYWDQRYDHDTMDKLFFGFGSESMDHSLRMYQQNSANVGFETRTSGFSSPPCLSPKTPNPTRLLFSSQCHPPEEDQVVPSLQKLSVYEHIPPCSPRRTTKPLPPLPDIGDLSSDEAEDNEVEFFSSTSESQCLVPKTSTFQYGLPGRRSFRRSGQINFAYCEGVQEHQKLCGVKPQWEQAVRQNQDRHQRRLHRSHSGPAGSFKATNFRPTSLHHSPHSLLLEKPEVPPRVPICARLSESTDSRQPSSDDVDTDKPPEVPPRDPIPQVIPRAISPKSLPIYINGVMPPTQSFAPYPEYVSKAQHKQSCEGLPAPRNPCILPIMEDGKKVSSTHYFLLPHRPGYLDKFERFFKESDS